MLGSKLIHVSKSGCWTPETVMETNVGHHVTNWPTSAENISNAFSRMKMVYLYNSFIEIHSQRACICSNDVLAPNKRQASMWINDGLVSGPGLNDLWPYHYCDVIMSQTASQITSLTIVCLIVYSGTDQRKHQSSASLAFVRRIHRRPVNSPLKWPVTRKMFPFDDAIMFCYILYMSVSTNEEEIYRGLFSQYFQPIGSLHKNNHRTCHTDGQWQNHYIGTQLPVRYTTARLMIEYLKMA